jgi:hypothetical protein
MEDAGLLQPGSYRPGVWDVRTAGRSNEEGWRAVLSFANVTGQSWEESFSRLYDAGTDASARGMRMELERLSRTPYFEDPEKLKQRTRQFMRSMGRAESEISDEELEMMMDLAAQGGQQRLMESMERRIEERQGQMLGGAGRQAAGALTGGVMPAGIPGQAPLDPIAAFDSALRDVFGREIASRDDQQAAQVGQRDFQSITRTFGSARQG